jgi:NAD+ synthase
MELSDRMNRFDPNTEIDRIENFIARKKSEIGFEKGIIGLSGGIDSSLTTVLVKRALSDRQIEVVFLPETTTPEVDRNDVESLARKFDLNVRTIELDGLVSAFEDKVGELSELGEANVKARIRMVILYALANQSNGLVIGTGNLSEWLLGYFTKYGDGAADLAPLTHLYKTELKPIARRLEVPESIITKPPSAGLWEGQTDEDELGGSYDQIDRVLYLKHDRGYGLNEAKGELDLDPDFVEGIYTMVENSSHKREEPAGLERSQ